MSQPLKSNSIKLSNFSPRITECHETSENFVDEIKIEDDRNVRYFAEVISTRGLNKNLNTLLSTFDDHQNGSIKTEKIVSPHICEVVKIEVEEKVQTTPAESSKSEHTLIEKEKEENYKNEKLTIKEKKKIEHKDVYAFFKINKIQKICFKIVHSSLAVPFELILLLANSIAYCMHDYSDRLNPETESTRVVVSFDMELLCNFIYVSIFLIKMTALGPKPYFKTKFNIFNVTIIIFSFLIYVPNEKASSVFRVIRLLRPLLLVQIVKPINDTFVAFFRTLYSIREIIFQICFLILFFAIFGLHMFQGLLESRCRLTKNPVNDLWPVNPNITNLCGSTACPANNFCENPSLVDFPYNHSEVDIADLDYGLSNFDTIFNSLLTSLHFFTFTGWSKVNDIYWTAYSMIVVAAYSIIFTFILGLIMMNLLMASLYEAFVSHTKAMKKKYRSNGKKKTTEIMHEFGQMNSFVADDIVQPNERKTSKNKISNLKNVNDKLITNENLELITQTNFHSHSEEVNVYYPGFTFEKDPLKNASKLRNLLYNIISSSIFEYTILGILLLDIGVLAADNSNISTETLIALEKIDFAVTWIFAIEIFLRLMIDQPRKFVSNYFNLLDLIIIIMNVGFIVWNFSNDISNFSTLYSSGSAIKCLKLLRIFRFLVGMVLWKRGVILFMEMIYSIYHIKEFIAFCFIVMFIFALIGRELFAFRVRFINEDEIPENLVDGKPPRINYDEIGDAWVATSLVFLNEEWHKIMYNNQRVVSHESALFFVIMLLLGTVFMMKMFMMLFINSLLQSKNIKKLFKIRNFFSECVDFIKKIVNIFQRKSSSLTETNVIIDYWKKTTERNAKNEIQLIKGNKNEKFESFHIAQTTSEKGISDPKFPEMNANSNLNMKESHMAKHFDQRFSEVTQKLTSHANINMNESHTKHPDYRASEINQKQISHEKLHMNLSHAQKLSSGNNLNMKESSVNKSPSTSPLKNSLKKTELIKLQLSKYRKKMIELEGNSLWLFSKENKFRLSLFKIITHNFFEKFIIFCILFSIVLLIISNPMNNPHTSIANLLYAGDCVVLGLYFIEILMKIITYGFLMNGSHSFLMDLWNFVDLLIFILTLMGTIDTRFPFSQYDFKWCRALRIFKIIQYNTGLKEALHNLLLSIPDIISLWLFYLMNLFFFGVIATKYLKNTLDYCSGLNEEALKNVITISDCFDYGGDWIKNDLSFNNIFDSLSTLFQISTTEGWMELMFQGWDQVGPNKNPVTDYNKSMAGFYIVFFAIANLILMNMIVGILVETYLFQKEKNDPASKYSGDQKEWSKIKEYIFKRNPKVVKPFPKNKFRLKVRIITKSRKFINFIIYVTLVNTLLFMLYWHRQPKEMKNALDYINAVFVAIFTIEILMNFISEGGSLFIRKPWNIFDIIIIVCSWIGFGLLMNPQYDDLRWVHALANCIQILRIIRVIKKVRFLKKLFSVFLNILPQIKNIFLLMFLLIITYSIIGVNFFVFLKPQHTVGGPDIHFRNFFTGLVNLARITTAEEWYSIMNDCARKTQPNFVCFKITHYDDYIRYGLEGCGNSVAYLYFFSYLIVNTLLILNLFVAMILNAAEEHKRSHSRTNEYRLDEIISLWKTFDPKGLGYLNYRDFYQFYKIIAMKFGVNHEEFLDPDNRMLFLKFCSIPIYEHINEKMYCVRFHDCVTKLAQMAAFINFGLKDLEPTEGFHHLLKYELKLIQNKEFELSPFKAEDIEKLRKIYKNLRNFYINKTKKADQKKILSFGDAVNLVTKNNKKEDKQYPKIKLLVEEKQKSMRRDSNSKLEKQFSKEDKLQLLRRESDSKFQRLKPKESSPKSPKNLKDS